MDTLTSATSRTCVFRWKFVKAESVAGKGISGSWQAVAAAAGYVSQRIPLDCGGGRATKLSPMQAEVR